MHSVVKQYTKMADPRKPTNSSMIDLKAELFRKQEEYKQLKAQNSSEFVKGVKSNKPGKGENIWSKKNAGVLQRASKDLAEKEEEDNVMERSRRALEAKSKIYNNIASASGIPEDDGSEGYLVDFQKKAVDRIVEERRGGGKMAATTAAETRGDRNSGADMSDDGLPNEDPIPLPADPSEEWVDYVDTFGRSRRCMKKDLPHLEKQERPLGRPPGDSGLKLKEGATLLSADMKRELRRQQWEKEMEESVNGPVHYANVQYDEIRSHGTGFYQFSKDSNLREEQMEELNKLREQTKDGRQRSERIKEKRKAALEARLAKVKQRRKMKDGSLLDVEDKKEEQEQKTGEDSAAPQEAEPLTREDAWRHSAPVREWDMGKEKMPEWNAKRYMEQRRSERENEFAPPQLYFDQKTSPGPREPGIPHRGSRPQNESGHNPSSQPSVLASSNTEAMLKQIRQSVGHEDAETGVDLASIPLPEMGSAAENVHTEVNGEKERQGAPVMVKDDKTDITSVHQRKECADVSRGQVQTPQQVQASHQQAVMFGGPVLDVSLPPPGYSGNLPFFGQPAGPVPPPHQSLQPSFALPLTQPSSFTASSLTQSSFTSSSSTAPLPVPADQGPPCAAAFVYPSQQGLLSPRPHPTPQATTITTTAQSSANSPAVSQIPAVSQARAVRNAPAVSQAPAAKGGLVDKRFMQNREVSEEDLLGYMAHDPDDPLTKIQPVAYTPGHFSAQLHKPASSQETAAIHATATTHAAATATSEREPKPAGQTEGVIFGVPDFLQPAAVMATSYQPGSFMAAKEAAAQRTEEEYEAARKKTQYSSAPVLYCKPDDDISQGGTDTSEDSLKKPAVTQPADEGDEEYAQFMREVKVNK